MIEKKKIIILITVIFFIILISTGLFIFVFPPKITGTTPKPDQTNVELNTEVIISFNKPVSQKVLDNFSITPQSNKIIPRGETKISGNSINFIPDKEIGLTPSSTYEIYVTPYSFLGIKGSSFRYIFTTKNAMLNSLPEAQQKLIIANQDYLESGKTTNAKLDALLPYENNYFYMVWISTTADENDYSVLLKGDYDSSKTIVQSWIKNKGYDPEKLDIKYGTLN